MTDSEIKSMMIAYEIVRTTTMKNRRHETFNGVQIDYERISDIKKVKESGFNEKV